MFTAPIPHDEVAETASFRKAFASAMKKVDPACSPPAQKPALVSGDSGAVLVGGTYFRSATDSPELPGAEAVHGALTESVASGDFEQAARYLIDLTALRPLDAFASDIRPIVPSTHEGFNTQIGQGRIVILAMCLRHIQQFGDGELSHFLGDSLQHLPHCEAHLDRLIKFDTAIFDGDIPDGSRCGLLLDALFNGQVSDSVRFHGSSEVGAQS